MKLTKTEQNVIDVIQGKKHWTSINKKPKNKNDIWRYTVNAKKAIESLKLKGIIKKDDDNMLRMCI